MDYVAIFIAGACVGSWLTDWADTRYGSQKIIKTTIQLQELIVTMTTDKEEQQRKFITMCRGFADREDVEFCDNRPPSD